MAAHRYWRIRVTATNNGFLHAAEIQFRATAGGADQAAGGTVLYSRQFDASTWAATNAFDNSTSTAWSVGSFVVGDYIGYDFGAGVSVAEVSWRTLGAFPTEWPTAGYVEYSDDGSAWTVATSFTFASWTANSDSNTISVPDVTVFSAAATLAGSAALTASATRNQQATATLSLTGDLSAAASVQAVGVVSASAIASATSALTVDATHAPQAAAALAGSAALVAAGLSRAAAISMLGAAGGFTAGALHTPQGAAALAGSTGLMAGAAHTPSGQVALGGSTALTADATVRKTVLFPFTALGGVATLAAQVTRVTRTEAILACTGSVSGSTARILAAASTLNGASACSGETAQVLLAGATATALGGLRVAEVVIPPQVLLLGQVPLVSVRVGVTEGRSITSVAEAKARTQVPSAVVLLEPAGSAEQT